MKFFLIVLFSVGYSQVNIRFTIREKLTNEEEDQPIEYAEGSLKNINDFTKMSTNATNKMDVFLLFTPKRSLRDRCKKHANKKMQRPIKIKRWSNLLVVKILIFREGSSLNRDAFFSYFFMCSATVSYLLSVGYFG